MIRYLTALLAALALLLGLPVLAQFVQAPMLDALVDDGTLEPIENRLPSQPLVAEPFETIGQYGGTLEMYHTVASSWNEVGSIAGRITPITTAIDGSFVPFLARDYELSEDARTITLYLREGLRWSDGAPHTADDYLYWFNSIILNSELTPVIPPIFRVGGDVMSVEKVDDYTVQFSFAIANPNFLVQLAINGDTYYAPRHYLERFHVDTADPDELAALVSEGGYTNWTQLFQDRRSELSWNNARRPAEAPTLAAFMVRERGINTVQLERNPYFWIVDPEGKQLPYIDSMRVELLTDSQVRTTKALNGEFSLYQGNSGDLPLFLQNRDRGNYRVLMWESVFNEYVLFPNQTHVNDTMREILQTPDFRRALSLAINREEINEIVYLGLGTPKQAAPAPGNAYFREEFARAYADYDPAEANRLLDELGFSWDSEGRYRLRPDGETLSLQIEVSAAYAPSHVQASELVVDYWRAIGIDARYQLRTQELFVEISRSSDFDVRAYALVTQPVRWRWLLREWVPTQPVWSGWSTLWSEWYVSDGREGMEPPQHIMALYEHHDTWNHHPDEATRDAALMAILEFQAENINLIGTVAFTPYPIIVNENLRNVPDGMPWFWDTGILMVAQPWTWYFATN